MHITLRARRDAGNLRSQSVLRVLVDRFRRASRGGFRVIHFSVQTDHLHLLVEAADSDVLARKMTGLTTWIARRLNALLRRSGALFADRYHRHDLRSPRETRNVLLYVLQNRRKHVFKRTGCDTVGVDPYSSSAWLIGGWCDDAERHLRDARATLERALGPPPPGRAEHAAPVAEPTTWLARGGWRRAKPGLLSVRERPAT